MGFVPEKKAVDRDFLALVRQKNAPEEKMTARPRLALLHKTRLAICKASPRAATIMLLTPVSETSP